MGKLKSYYHDQGLFNEDVGDAGHPSYQAESPSRKIFIVTRDGEPVSAHSVKADADYVVWLDSLGEQVLHDGVHAPAVFRIVELPVCDPVLLRRTMELPF